MVADDLILEVDNVFAGYGEIEVLKGLSCRAHRGSITSIVGANGAGKSTLLKTIFGLVPARQGRVTYMGRDITHMSPLEILKAGISYVPQGRCNFPQMSVQENLEMGAFVRDDDQIEGDIDEMCDRFTILQEKRSEMAGNLSGGQQQIMEMAMALLLHPSLLLVDEPSLGLAPRMVDVVFDGIAQINAIGTTVLMVEQNAKKALSVSDHGFVLELGRNWLDGTGKELLENPQVRLHYLGL